MHTNFGEDRTCSFEDMIMDRQTHTHTAWSESCSKNAVLGAFIYLTTNVVLQIVKMSYEYIEKFLRQKAAKWPKFRKMQFLAFSIKNCAEPCIERAEHFRGFYLAPTGLQILKISYEYIEGFLLYGASKWPKF